MNTIIGHKEVEVTRVVNSELKTEKVKVRQLPIKEYHDYLAAIDNESKMIELLCGVDATFVESLTPESFEAIIVAGDELNADFFYRWVQRRLNRNERIAPGITDKMLASASKDSLPNSPLSVDTRSHKPASAQSRS